MEIRLYERDGITVAELQGALDFEASSLVQERLRTLLRQHNSLVVDLSGVQEVYAVGLGALLSVEQWSAAPQRMVFCSARPFFKELLRVTLVDRQLTVAGDLQEAIERMAAAQSQA